MTHVILNARATTAEVFLWQEQITEDAGDDEGGEQVKTTLTTLCQRRWFRDQPQLIHLSIRSSWVDIRGLATPTTGPCLGSLTARESNSVTLGATTSTGAPQACGGRDDGGSGPSKEGNLGNAGSGYSRGERGPAWGGWGTAARRTCRPVWRGFGRRRGRVTRSPLFECGCTSSQAAGAGRGESRGRRAGHESRRGAGDVQTQAGRRASIHDGQP